MVRHLPPWLYPCAKFLRNYEDMVFSDRCLKHNAAMRYTESLYPQSYRGEEYRNGEKRNAQRF